MTTYKPGDIVEVPFPFIESAVKKLRPALVVTDQYFQNDSGAVVLLMVTSAERSHWESDVELLDWQSAGLRKASIVRWKIFTIDEQLIVSRRGALSAQDQRRIRDSFNTMFDHWIGGNGASPAS